MNKSIKIAGLVLIGGLVLIQFFQPERNLGTEKGKKDLLTITQVPDSLAIIFKNSCYDCHSDRTSYPLYSYISPVSWYLEKHIRNGKDALNFSSFGDLEKKQRIGALSNICDVLESGSMPLKSYLLIHQSSRISEADKEALCNWAEMEALKIMRE